VLCEFFIAKKSFPIAQTSKLQNPACLFDLGLKKQAGFFVWKQAIRDFCSKKKNSS